MLPIATTHQIWKGVYQPMSRITSPESFFGHQLGADRKIARWDKVVDYYYLLAKESDRMQPLFPRRPT